MPAINKIDPQCYSNIQRDNAIGVHPKFRNSYARRFSPSEEEWQTQAKKFPDATKIENKGMRKRRKKKSRIQAYPNVEKALQDVH